MPNTSPKLKVSVVIPVFNEEQYLTNCLDSLMEQSEKADEILIVDNNSSDKSVKIAQMYPSVTIIREKKQGITPTRNRGFNAAQYDIIVRTDADTIVPKDWLKKIKKHFKIKNVVAVSGPTSFYDLPSTVTKKAAMNVHKTYLKLMNQILKHYSIFGPNMAIRRDAWIKIRNEVCNDDVKIHEDIDLAIHVAHLGKIIFDRHNEVSSSFRRFKNLDSIDSYFDYPYRVVTSIQKHKSFSVRKNGKRLMKKISPKVFIKHLQIN